MIRRLNDKMDYGLKEMNEMEYGLEKMNEMNYGLKEMNRMDSGLKEMNDNMPKAEGMQGWVVMSWWNLIIMKSITEQKMIKINSSL